MPQFLYHLSLSPRLHTLDAWTDADRAAVGAHFAHLQAAAQAGRLVLAGRTQEPNDQTFGIAVFEAPDEAAARAFMEADPAVQAGVMRATLHPYAIAVRGDAWWRAQGGAA